jgi:N-acetylneuraminate synthase
MKLGNIIVKDYAVPYIIAEIGANHNGDMELAFKIIDAAKSCGCNAVKFQSWTPDSLISEEEYDRNQQYNDSPKKHFGSLRQMVEKYYLRPEQHEDLKRYCDQVGIDFSSTPFSDGEADLLDRLGVSYFKIASMDINNLKLIRRIAARQKPILLSTGMASLAEIENALNVIEKEKNSQIVLLHCVSIYPPDNADINLNNIHMLRRAFGYPTGFSDHTIGTTIPLAAVCLGSSVIEKHFTLNKALPGWDHEISADPIEMEYIVQKSKKIVQAMGSFRRRVKTAEKEKKLKFGRSLLINKDVRKGHVLTENDFGYKRPGTGIRPDESRYVIGRSVNRNLKSDELIQWSDLN